MISVLPAKTPEEQQLLLKNHEIHPGYNCLYRAEERGAETGWFSLHCNNDCVTVLQLEVNACKGENAMTEDDKYMVELLIRTAASYGINHAATRLCYKPAEFRDFLRMFGFAENEQGTFELEISRLLHGCGHCGHSD